ncbi:MAG TPA: protein TolR [Desulfobulbaceae bacterium]|nr:protein TolR [Desulfobulbaceae bacterium]
MSISGKKGGKRLVSDINVTPLVDVMLVLLIIFMVTAPMMTQGIDLDLHETTDAAQPREQNDKPLVISVSKDGQITLNDTAMSGNDQLMQELAQRSEEDKKNQMLVIRAERGVPYGKVASLFADARNAGFLNLTPAIR